MADLAVVVEEAAAAVVAAAGNPHFSESRYLSGAPGNPGVGSL